MILFNCGLFFARLVSIAVCQKTPATPTDIRLIRKLRPSAPTRASCENYREGKAAVTTVPHAVVTMLWPTFVVAAVDSSVS